ncbi:GTP cyclohydrolase I [Beggiatoa alba B18LD]|uniref:GTP cyclohydrolase 1 n=1 Tax=Beggiatoa alba B18LD TaxID=395493 RepID=I3CHL7_9GAMM|nr:GTP cyclohydrolase I FolE [Beggiatoa alba]EIJ43110.1 GTP cyclohydrolase I [Beggiatoa alba B18LD]
MFQDASKYPIQDNAVDVLTSVYRDIITNVGEDVTRDGLLKTPERAAKAILRLTSGYQQDLQSIVNGALFESDSDQVVLVRDIEFYSLCEHHLLPFFGKCHVGYLPRGKVLGLSKVARIVDMFSRRLQIQEQLTHQVALAIQECTDAYGVGVVMDARHMCMIMRGVEKQSSSTTTSAMLGTFRQNPAARAEFLSLIASSNSSL